MCAASKRYFAFPSGSGHNDSSLGWKSLQLGIVDVHLMTDIQDNSVRIWDVSKHQRVADLTRGMGGVNSIAIDSSGKYLASGEIKKNITI